MDNRIKISDFVKLTGSTLKTVMYYHKIGLLQDPERSPAGYRLYGSAELFRMQMIKHFKDLGLDLTRIKKILGDSGDEDKTLREVLGLLREDLLNEKKSLEERVEKIDRLLGDDRTASDDKSFSSASFQMISEILAPEQMEKYAQSCPELLGQQQKLFGILDDFQWGEDYQENFRGLAVFFKDHPEQYQTALRFGTRLSALDRLSEDDPEIEALARESAAFIKSIPELKEMLCKKPAMKKPQADLYNDMVSAVVSPARIRHGELLRQYLSEVIIYG